MVTSQHAGGAPTARPPPTLTSTTLVMTAGVGTASVGPAAALITTTDSLAYKTMIDCYFIIAVPLIILGCSLLLYSIISKSSVHSIEGSLYFVGPIVILTGTILLIKVFVLRHEYKRRRRAQQLGVVLTGVPEVDEANITRVLRDQPPSYHRAVSYQPVSNSNDDDQREEEEDGRGGAAVTDVGDDSPPPSYAEHLSTLHHTPPSTHPAQVPVQAADSSTSPHHVEDGESGAHPCSHSLFNPVTSQTADNESASEPPPPSYDSLHRASQQPH